MQLHLYSNGRNLWPVLKTKTILAMKMLSLFLLACCMKLSATGYSQTISISVTNSPLEKVLKDIEKQSSVRFIYSKSAMEQSVPVTLTLQNASLEVVLKRCFEKQPLGYELDGKYVIVSKSNQTLIVEKALEDIKGRVVNEKGEPLEGISVSVKGTKIQTSTNANGEFILHNVAEQSVLMISGAEMSSIEVKVNGRNYIPIVLQQKIGELDETIVVGYGSTTKRLNTGNVSKVSAAEIERQPVGNPLAALSGRVPGLEVIQSSGVPGSSIKIQIRGINSLLQGTEPLFVIDGVPFSPGNSPVNELSNSAGPGSVDGISPFNTINPADIESIEVLKDADATAIYGSRGANGVILITTKKGQEGASRISLQYYAGASRTTRTMDRLNTKQYVQLRRDAFTADGTIPTIVTAPDILLWDTTRYTDLAKLLTGNTAYTHDVQLSFSGGNSNTQYLLGGGYRKESTVFTSDLSDKRASMHLSLNHHSSNNKFRFNFTGGYSVNNSKLLRGGLSNYINLPPNIKLYDDAGNLNWEEGGVSFSSLSLFNPMAFLHRTYKGVFKNLSGNLLPEYTILPGLILKSSFGYNLFLTDETSLYPQSSIDPASNITAFSNFGNSSNSSWIIEPQLVYVKNIHEGKLTLLAGGTWQEQQRQSLYIEATNFSNDQQLASLSAAGTITATNDAIQYKYTAFFGRISYNWKQRYLTNLSGRRDGSSRFGPGRRFANFGAAGAGWVFSEEPFFEKAKKKSILSFGKLRASYGITGNDQIGDYRFFDTWSVAYTTYQGSGALQPTRLFNPDYGWEVNRKAELGIELGFLKDRILLNFSVYQNRAGNQLINYRLPVQTGFTSILENFDAVLENKGFELLLSSKNISRGKFKWESTLNLSVQRNKLISFPGLTSSSYASIYAIDYPVSIIKAFEYLGVDPATGIYQYKKVDSSSTSYTTKDRVMLINTNPSFYGGTGSHFSYKNWQLDIFFEFKKQIGRNYLYTQSAQVPGTGYFNQPVVALQHWQQSGDITTIQRLTALNSSAAYKAANLLRQSNAIFSNASYIRLKNLSCSWSMPDALVQKLKMNTGRIYLQAQNVFTLTRYIGADPENQNMNTLAPLKTFTVGCQLTF